MEIAILLFQDLTALDAIGPYEVLQRLPGATVKFVAKTAGVYRTDSKSLGLVADFAIADVPAPDIVLIPGGFGETAVCEDAEVLAWVRAAHETSTWTTSVCTGSLILGAAGILDGLKATTHWGSMERLASYGAEPTGERVVFQGKVVTAAGVSSGIDMALHLAARIGGDALAQAIQLSIEYDPEPPFDAGSPEKAPPEVLEAVRVRSAKIRARLAEAAASGS